VGILDEDVARVREATDFVALAGEHIALKRVGHRWVGLCPFHAEKTPSFSVNAEMGLYYCFGCAAKGDVITFVREVEHLDFAEAVERLAARAGVQLRYDDATTGRERQRRERLYEAMERAVGWYHERLLGAPDAGPARTYLRSRGYDGEAVRMFRLGWAPDEWDAMARALALPDEVLEQTGLGMRNRRNRQQDRFRGRVMFPIFDTSGRPVAFGGRVLPPELRRARPEGASVEGPKYVNSAETPIYSKSRTLYGLNWAKAAIVETGEAIVCEGYTDVIGLFRVGLGRAVATCGTALADEHFRTLKNFARRVVLAYDADSAGQAAAERFSEWERRYEIDISVASLPADADPGDLARGDPDGLRAAVAEARPFMSFRLDRALARADLRSPEGRARAAERALPVIAEHPNDLVRDQYVMEVADRCRVPPARLREGLAEAIGAQARKRASGHQASGSGQASRARPGATDRQRGRDPAGGHGGPGGGDDQDGSERAAQPARPGRPVRPERPERAAAAPGPAPGRAQTGGDGAARRVEVEALRLTVHRPEDVADRIDEALFTDEVHLAAFRALAGASTFHEALGSAAPDAAALLQRLAVEESDAEADDVIALLVKQAVTRAIVELEARARESDQVVPEVAKTLAWLKPAVEELQDPDTRVGACDRLVAWLVQRGEEDE
jgi:DNA primase